MYRGLCNISSRVDKQVERSDKSSALPIASPKGATDGGLAALIFFKKGSFYGFQFN